MVFEMKLTKNRILRWFLINLTWKMNPLFAEVVFFDDEVESFNFLGLMINTPITSFTFWIDTFNRKQKKKQ